MRVVLVAEEVGGGVQLGGQHLELLAVGSVAEHLHAHGRDRLPCRADWRARPCEPFLLEQCGGPDECGNVVARAEGPRVRDPDLVGGLLDRVGEAARARVESGQVVAHVDGRVGVGALPVLGRAGSVLVGGAHGAGEQLVDALRVACERVERHVAHHGDVHHHAHGLGPQVVDVGHEGDALRLGRFGANARDVVGRDLRVHKIVGAGVLCEVLAQVLSGNAVAADAPEVEVLRVAWLLDEHDAIGKALVAGLRAIALRLLPVLERGRDEVDGEALAREQLREEAEARVAARLVAQLHAHRHDSDALGRACGALRRFLLLG